MSSTHEQSRVGEGEGGGIARDRAVSQKALGPSTSLVTVQYWAANEPASAARPPARPASSRHVRRLQGRTSPWLLTVQMEPLKELI